MLGEHWSDGVKVDNLLGLMQVFMDSKSVVCKKTVTKILERYRAEIGVYGVFILVGF